MFVIIFILFLNKCISSVYLFCFSSVVLNTFKMFQSIKDLTLSKKTPKHRTIETAKHCNHFPNRVLGFGYKPKLFTMVWVYAVGHGGYCFVS